MRRRGCALAVVAIMAALAAGACSKGKAATNAAPTTTVPARTTSSTVGVDQIPPVITVEYAQRVMNALDKAEGDATRLLYANKLPNTEWRNRLTALFDGKAFDNAEADFGRDAAHNFDKYRNPPGDPITIVNGVYDSTTTCVALDVSRNFGPMLIEQPAPSTLKAIVFLRPKKPDRDPGRINPTAWAITADGQPADGVDLTHICHA